MCPQSLKGCAQSWGHGGWLTSVISSAPVIMMIDWRGWLQVHAEGFVTNMHEFMAACDAIITKAGAAYAFVCVCAAHGSHCRFMAACNLDLSSLFPTYSIGR